MSVRLEPDWLSRWLFPGRKLGRFVGAAGALAGLMVWAGTSADTLVTLPVDPPAEAAESQVFNSGVRQVSLLELYSSQGCKNCPPAERWMTGLKRDERLWQQFVPVVFHVDYWDSLGWRDAYSTFKHSQRQRMYQVHGYTKAVYTPGFILDGQEWIGWFDTPELPRLSGAEVGELHVTITEGKAKARFVRDPDTNGDAAGLILNAAVLGFDIVTEVTRGTNKGLQIPQDFVVLNYKTFGSDTGRWDVSIPSTDFDGCTAVAFWISQNSDPTPIQATGGWYRLAQGGEGEDATAACANQLSD